MTNQEANGERKGFSESSGPLYDMARLVNMDDPASVHAEVKRIVLEVFPDYQSGLLDMAFSDTVSLFNGSHPGYRGCNTMYHDLRHTTDVYLALARLIHGSHIIGRTHDKGLVTLSLIAALLHDSGYIQKSDDADGTGAKYTLLHVRRSIDFMDDYFGLNGLSRADALCAACMVGATDLGTRIEDIPFKSEGEKTLGRLLMAADMLGQMADRTYLEKLLFLYHEFLEGGLSVFKSEEDLLNKTLSFYDMIDARLRNICGYSEHLMRSHFARRFGVPHDLYMESIMKNISYLKSILQEGGGYREKLNRGGIVGRIREIEASRAA